MMKVAFLKTAQKLYQRALGLAKEGEKKVFITIFAGLGTLLSVAVGGLCQHFLEIPYVFYTGMICASFVLLPASVLVGILIWDKWQKSRALSGDPFEYLKYLRDDYESDLREIRELKLNEKDKKDLVKRRYEEYQERKTLIRDRIDVFLEQRGLLPPGDSGE